MKNTRITVPVNRASLLINLAKMPEEAFSWFVGWAQGNMVQYPDGLGGFRPESRDSITRLREVAKDYKGE